ncbi:MAG: hypothetical protein AB197_00490 [Parcubacteria bacterium C7867-002]|nr:MAG: hypothetical protein AB197_00490 [Parcubacteria bacterium C7867-002]
MTSVLLVSLPICILGFFLTKSYLTRRAREKELAIRWAIVSTLNNNTPRSGRDIYQTLTVDNKFRLSEREFYLIMNRYMEASIITSNGGNGPRVMYSISPKPAERHYNSPPLKR